MYPLCPVHGFEITKTHKRCRVLGERSRRQWDAAMGHSLDSTEPGCVTLRLETMQFCSILCTASYLTRSVSVVECWLVLNVFIVDVRSEVCTGCFIFERMLHALYSSWHHYPLKICQASSSCLNSSPFL